MTVTELQRIRQLGNITPDAFLRPTDRPANSEGPGFAETLSSAIGEVDTSQKVADENIEAFIAGEKENLHDVMISMNEAKLHFQLMTEVRNRMLETYQELMRMQV